jgi:hypothetical protein
MGRLDEDKKIIRDWGSGRWMRVAYWASLAAVLGLGVVAVVASA